MTTVTIDIKHGRYRIVAEGHAGDPEVCHGISALMYMIAGCMLNRAKYINVRVLESGYIHLDFVSHSRYIKEDVRALIIGLLQIEMGHPDNLKVNQKILCFEG